MRAGVLIVIGLVGLAAAGIGVNVLLRTRGASRGRSVVVVTIDTLRADRLGSYGRTPSITPRLDALAARAVLFERAYTVAPLTVPAHASLFTGLLPPQHGLRVNQPPVALPSAAERRFATLAETLKAERYATAAFVSGSVLRGDATGLAFGFDVYDDVPRAAAGSLHDSERRGEDTVARALAWVRDEDGPIFLWVHLFDPHAPYDAPVGFGAGPAHRADAQGYDGEVAYVDRCVGSLVDGLAAAGREDAVLVVAADHGESLGEHGEATHGYLLHDATLRVPLLVAAPGLAAARRADAVSLVDVFPTVLALAGAPAPPQGNRADLFAKDRASGPRPIYSESLYAWHTSRWAQEFSLRRGDEKIVLSGQRRAAFDLAHDPAEERTAALDASQEEEAASLMRVAREPELGTATPTAETLPSGPYWSVGGGSATPVLSDAENAKLPSPYDRMDELRRFDDACGLIAGGQLEPGLALLEEILTGDPGNLQAAFWRGLALEKLGRNADAAAAFRAAFDAGFRSANCVAKALQVSLKFLEDAATSVPDRAAESDRAAEFLADARGRGVNDDARTYLLEAFLRERRGEVDLAREALERARKLPHDERVARGIAECAELLAAPRKQR